jgi:hypothetical protein
VKLWKIQGGWRYRACFDGRKFKGMGGLSMKITIELEIEGDADAIGEREAVRLRDATDGGRHG